MKMYKIGESQKAGRWTNKDSEKHGDIRRYTPPRGYNADATLTDVDVITGRHLEQAIWFVVLTKRGF